MSYWDTSTLVKLFAQEPDSSIFEHHASGTASTIVTSRIGLYEARATFRRKEAEGILPARGAATLYAKLLQDVNSGQLQVIEVGPSVEREYGRILDLCYANSPPLAVRTLDALHLATASSVGELELVATDKRLRDAAKLLNFTLFPT